MLSLENLFYAEQSGDFMIHFIVYEYNVQVSITILTLTYCC